MDEKNAMWEYLHGIVREKENLREFAELQGFTEWLQDGLKLSIAVAQDMTENDELLSLQEKRKEIQRKINDYYIYLEECKDFEQFTRIRDEIKRLKAEKTTIDIKIKEVREKLRKERKPAYETKSELNNKLKLLKEIENDIKDMDEVRNFIMSFAETEFNNTFIRHLNEHLEKLELKRLQEQKKQIEQQIREKKAKKAKK